MISVVLAYDLPDQLYLLHIAKDAMLKLLSGT